MTVKFPKSNKLIPYNITPILIIKTKDLPKSPWSITEININFHKTTEILK